MWKKPDGSAMTNDEVRRHTANHIFGLSKAIRLLMDGLKQNVGPEVFSEEQIARLRAVAASMHASRNELLKLAEELWDLQPDDSGSGNGLNDTTKL